MKGLFFSILIAAMLIGAVSGWAETGVANVEEYKVRLENLEQATQAQVAMLSEQAEATKDAATQEEIARQATEIKWLAEIQRLEILLEWAQAEGDEARIAEVQTALDNWRNPPQPQVLPQVPRSDAPGTDSKPASESQNTR